MRKQRKKQQISNYPRVHEALYHLHPPTQQSSRHPFHALPPHYKLHQSPLIYEWSRSLKLCRVDHTSVGSWVQSGSATHNRQDASGGPSSLWRNTAVVLRRLCLLYCPPVQEGKLMWTAGLYLEKTNSTNKTMLSLEWNFSLCSMFKPARDASHR